MTQVLPKTLSEVKVNDFVVYSISIGRGGSKLIFRRVLKIDDKGRLYFTNSPNASWRDSYDPKTGACFGNKRSPGIRVPAPDELEQFLRETADQQRQRDEREAYRSRQDYKDAACLASSETEAWLERFTPEELHTLAERMRK